MSRAESDNQEATDNALKLCEPAVRFLALLITPPRKQMSASMGDGPDRGVHIKYEQIWQAREALKALHDVGIVNYYIEEIDPPLPDIKEQTDVETPKNTKYECQPFSCIASAE